MEHWKQYLDSVYEVSTEGRIKNVQTGHILTPTYSHGYLRVKTSQLPIKNPFVHKLVALTFIPIPDELRQFIGTQNLQINHKDENPTNNRVENLEWCTAKYNSNYGTRNERMGAKLKGRRPSDATIKACVERCRRAVEKYTKDDVYLETYESIAEAARQNENVNHANIVKCCQGKIKSTGDFKWRYADS